MLELLLLHSQQIVKGEHLEQLRFFGQITAYFEKWISGMQNFSHIRLLLEGRIDNFVLFGEEEGDWLQHKVLDYLVHIDSTENLAEVKQEETSLSIDAGSEWRRNRRAT